MRVTMDLQASLVLQFHGCYSLLKHRQVATKFTVGSAIQQTLSLSL